jgi:hypothetical protein
MIEVRYIIKKILLVLLLFILMLSIMFIIERIRYQGFYKQSINSKILDIENYHDRVLYFYYSKNEHISDLDLGENLRVGDSISKQNNSRKISIYRQDTSGYRFYKTFMIK